jgi:hypothetical protein
VTLQFIDHRRSTADRSWLPPFDWSIVYENDRWWNEVRYSFDPPWFVQVLVDGVEVARVEFDDPGVINPEYTAVPAVGSERLEIQFIEVATEARLGGLGTQVVRALEDRHADRRLFAYSQQADRFWTKLGWERFEHPNGINRPLFIQPER